jgi:hypothetical protein
MKREGSTARMGEIRKACKTVIEKFEGKRSLERSKCRWEDYIKIDLKELSYKVEGWVRRAQERDQWRVLVNTGVNFLLTREARNLLTN